MPTQVSTACSQGLTTLLNGLSFLPLQKTTLMPLGTDSPYSQVPAGAEFPRTCLLTTYAP